MRLRDLVEELQPLVQAKAWALQWEFWALLQISGFGLWTHEPAARADSLMKLKAVAGVHWMPLGTPDGLRQQQGVLYPALMDWLRVTAPQLSSVGGMT